jgi:SAM-dependent methyltransferase
LLGLLKNKIKAALLPYDPRAQAFDHFYEELLQSKAFPQFFKFPLAYNLLSLREEQFLEEVLQRNRTNTVIDFGCGLGLARAKAKHREAPWYGIDFSKVAIRQCQQHFPSENWQHSYLPERLTQRCDLLIAIDSLYHPPMRSRQLWLKKLLSQVHREALIIQNSKEREEFLPINGFKLTLIETGQEFYERCLALEKFLLSEDVKEEKRHLPLLWATIERENNSHLKTRPKRMIALYEKITS